MDIQVDVSQLAVLNDFFNELSNLDKKKIFTSAFRKASLPLINTAKNLVPRRRGILAKSIGAIFMAEDTSALIGTRRAQRGSLGHIFENGTAERFRKKHGKGATGKIVGIHFMEKAFEMTEDKVYDMIEMEWYNAIDRFIQRTNKPKK